MADFFTEVLSATRRNGFNPVVGDMPKKQQQWYNWYRGDVNGFHLFQRKVAGKVRDFERQTLNMPKKIAEDYATLIWNEECQINFAEEETKKLVEGVLERSNFYTAFTELLESSFGVGMAYMVQYLAAGKTEIDFIPFDHAIPLGHNNGKINAIVTLNPFTINQDEETKQITHMTYHFLDENEHYNILHEAYVSEKEGALGSKSSAALREVFSDEDLAAMREVEVDENGKKSGERFIIQHETSRPFFQVLKPNIKNHFENNTPYGIPVTATLIPSFKVVDTIWDMYLTEMEDNKTRIILDQSMMQVRMVENEQTGEYQFLNFFDETDTTYVGLPFKDTRTDQKAIEFLQGTLRMEQITLALNKALQVVGFRAGLGKKFYSFDEGAVYTNEANVIHSNADTYKSKKKHEIIVHDVIENLIRSILYLEKELGNYKGDPEKSEFDIVFDDSIVQDDTSEYNTTKTLADDGYVPKWYAVAKGLKLSEDEAKRLVAEAAEEDRVAAELFLKPNTDPEDEGLEENVYDEDLEVG